MIEELKLIARDNSDPINKVSFNGNADISIDKYGQFERCSGEEGFHQNLVKAILTSSQPDSYGTNLKSLLHKKNLYFIRGRSMIEILNSFSVLKNAQLAYYQKYKDYNSKNVIIKVYEIFVNKINAVSLFINLKANSLYNQQIQSDKFQEINDIQIT